MYHVVNMFISVVKLDIVTSGSTEAAPYWAWAELQFVALSHRPRGDDVVFTPSASRPWSKARFTEVKAEARMSSLSKRDTLKSGMFVIGYKSCD